LFHCIDTATKQLRPEEARKCLAPPNPSTSPT
jgi:hypothetical protein